MRKFLWATCLSFCLMILFAALPVFAVDTEAEMFNTIQDRAMRHDVAGLKRKANEFFKVYPNSKFVPEVRFLLAENEPNPMGAIDKYRALIDKFRDYPRRDEAEIGICRIYELLGNWKSLQQEALAALKKFPESGRTSEFQLFYCKAALCLNEYDEGQLAAKDVITREKDYDALARAILLDAQADRSKTGYSRSYIYDLRELITGYDKHYSHPTVLLLLADFYEKTGEAGKALGAYENLKRQYPKSPEAAMMRKRMAALERRGITAEAFYPDKKLIDSSQTIDLSFNGRQLSEDFEDTVYYSVAVGPFAGKKQAEGVLPILRRFGTVKSFLKHEGFFHYTGNYKTTDEALACKIRLAEEYGINGAVVRISLDGGKSYIYGEGQ